MISRLQIKVLASTACAGLLLTGIARAAEGDTTNVYIIGTIVEAPDCTVNGNNRIDVDFGDNIITRQINGTNFRQPIEYELNCTGLASDGLTVSVRGNPAAFGSGLIDAGKSGLAIQLWNGSAKLANGVAVPFTWPGKPALSATLVAEDNTILTAGEFSSVASMVLSYQ